jgi:pimeloyl-ACP methyl ester carboxylesterase
MTPLHDRLIGVQAPTLVITGEFDPVRFRSESVARGIPGATHAVIDRVGHAPHLEAPASFRSVVLPFLHAPTDAEETN